jgi:hypothetical protein
LISGRQEATFLLFGFCFFVAFAHANFILQLVRTRNNK